VVALATQRHDVRATGLESLQSRVDAVPAARDEVDEQGEIVEPGLPLGEQFLLDPLEPVDRLIEEASLLCETPSDHRHLACEPLLDGRGDEVGQSRFEVARSPGEALDLRAGAFQGSFEAARGVAVGASFVDSLFCSFEHVLIHGDKVTLAIG